MKIVIALLLEAASTSEIKISYNILISFVSVGKTDWIA
jgi:hypothetical protein